jgi:potassium/hydrogen antiporter
VDVLDEIRTYAVVVLGISAAVLAALLASRLLARLSVPIPEPAVFLLGAAGVASLFPSLRSDLSILGVERIATVVLIVILFSGGMELGLRRVRRAAVPILSLGVLGTFATAALVAVAAHLALDLDWTPAWLLGAALAPTDPAVMFSVLGGKEVTGRTGTILQGEAGANDPAGIALMIGLIEVATTEGAGAADVVVEFVVEMAVGLAIGLALGWALVQVMRRVPLPGAGLYPLRTLAASGLIYGVATVAHGSGFLAVFVAGMLVGDARAPYKGDVERFHGALASLGEIVVFVALGLTVSYGSLGEDGLWLDALLIGALLALLIRPLAVGPLLLPVRLRAGERLFIMWSGLKGAVPIILAALAVTAGAGESERIYRIVFVVVALSVVVQGASVPLAARRLGVPMRDADPRPFDLAIRLGREPSGVQRLVVADGSRAAGRAIRELPIGERTWVSVLVRDGEPVVARGSTVLQPGDELVVMAEPEAAPALRHLFGARAS